MAFEKIKIRIYNGQVDRAGVEDLERRCEVGPAERVFLFTDTMGDPICRIRNSPMYNMLVAESADSELVGVIQGSIKVVTVHNHPRKLARVGYVLGLRVSPLHRRRGIGTSLVRRLEEWFASNQVDYAYMATEMDNQASVGLFLDKLGFVKFRTPAILVQPVLPRPFRIRSGTQIAKLKVEHAEFLYRKYMGSAEFFPDDIDKVLRKKPSLGTWVAYRRGQPWGDAGSSWAMLSVWNSGELFKMRIGKAPLSCVVCAKTSRLIDRVLPCLGVPAVPDFFTPFGFYFMYGVYGQGAHGGKLVRALCRFVHNMAAGGGDCRLIVTEVGGWGCEQLSRHIPHWKLLSCPEDLWCIKPLRGSLHELTKTPPTTPLFVDPREV